MHSLRIPENKESWAGVVLPPLLLAFVGCVWYLAKHDQPSTPTPNAGGPHATLDSEQNNGPLVLPRRPDPDALRLELGPRDPQQGRSESFGQDGRRKRGGDSGGEPNPKESSPAPKFKNRPRSSPGGVPRIAEGALKSQNS
jgi:hypothetical protein